jgi:hypothetical protein
VCVCPNIYVYACARVHTIVLIYDCTDTGRAFDGAACGLQLLSVLHYIYIYTCA